MTDIIKEILEVAESGVLPDGDEVNVPTLLWLEDLVERAGHGDASNLVGTIACPICGSPAIGTFLNEEKYYECDHCKSFINGKYWDGKI